MMVRRVAAVVACVSLVLAGGKTVAQETTILRGEVLTRDGRPTEGVRLFLTGHPPEVVIRDGGIFSHPLTGSPTEVSARVAGSGDVGIIYPPGGRLAVPGDPSAVVTIIVGTSLGEGVLDAIEAQQELIRETLESRNVAPEAIESALEADIEGLLQELTRMNRDLVSEARNEAEQAEARREISATLTTYRRRLWDLLEVFQLLGPDTAIGPAEQFSLRDAMTAYNQAFEALDTRRSSMVDDVRRYWPEDEFDALGASLESTLTLVLETFHGGVLDLNAALVVIQREINDGSPSDDDVRAAEEAVGRVTSDLKERFPTLELALSQLLAELGMPSGGVE
jgi:hypothetical protein